jgi:3-ketosteroid 9alpha-monooxygenase subunit A
MNRAPRPRAEERGFDFGPYPNSWIQIAWSHELRRGQVAPLRALGRELVLFRGNDGQARVLDAHCPHLGAHLAVGGTVVGDDVRCPFHGWQFDGEGACTKIPGTRKIPARARATAYPVREIHGLIFLWHHDQGHPPSFEIPVVSELGSDAWTRPHFEAITIRTRWRELVENAVDRAHFHALHGYPEPPELELRTEGHAFHMKSRVRWRRFGRDLNVTLDIDSFGAGFAVTRAVGDAPFIVVGCPMPIDEHTTEELSTNAAARAVASVVLLEIPLYSCVALPSARPLATHFWTVLEMIVRPFKFQKAVGEPRFSARASRRPGGRPRA